MTEEEERFVKRYHAEKEEKEKAKREAYIERRKRFDHERYMRNREDRLKRQREYYNMNRENILLKKYEREQLLRQKHGKLN